jgi:XK-related protein
MGCVVSRVLAIFIPMLNEEGELTMKTLTDRGVWAIALMWCLHWLVTLIWLVKSKPNSVCHLKNKHLMRPLLALIYVFTFFNPHKGRARWHYSVYYFLLLIENALSVLLVMVVLDGTPQSLNDLLGICDKLIPSLVSIILGIFFMICFYTCFHPSRPGCCGCGDRDQQVHHVTSPSSPSWSWVGGQRKFSDSVVNPNVMALGPGPVSGPVPVYKGHVMEMVNNFDVTREDKK